MAKRAAKRSGRKKQAISNNQSAKKSFISRQIIIIALILCTLGAGLAIARFKAPSLFRAQPTSAPQGSLAANNPSKEYIYAGGRLIATEEPTSTGGSSAAPTSLVATSASSAQINLMWAASSGAASYQVERSQSVNGPYTPLSPNPTTASFPDTSVTSGTAYLYRVRAVDSNGTPSAYSNLDLATAVSFTDEPLTSNVTIIKGQHLTELRQAVNAVRSLAGLTASSWTDPSPQGVSIKRVHIMELRSGLDQALTTLGLNAEMYTDPTLPTGSSVKAIHFEELRQRVK
jgi:hypothetical protein